MNDEVDEWQKVISTPTWFKICPAGLIQSYILKRGVGQFEHVSGDLAQTLRVEVDQLVGRHGLSWKRKR